ncbi:MAG: ABC transporter ATP-binding protein [Deltaproteobacteria bacterium]|nr:ABC transporter ATP-binding protein [Deltaproteobacteria bacterium]
MSLLNVENLGISFGGIRALKDVAFEVHLGEIFSILGPNGAGKTTLFNCVNGIYKPDAGRVLFEGKPITGIRPDKAARLGIARTFQNIELFGHMTTMDNLLLGRHLHMKTNVFTAAFFGPGVRREEIAQREEAERIIDFLDLQAYRDMPVAALPYGVRKMVELGRALATKPRLLLLDEPCAGMNHEERSDMAIWIQDIREDLGVTCLLVEHDMNLVMRISDRVLVLDHGEVLACGKPEAVAANEDVARAYLGAGHGFDELTQPPHDAGAADG